MPTVASIMAELKKKGTAQTQKTYARHGMAPENTFGVSIAELKGIAKTIKGQASNRWPANSTKLARWRRCTSPRWWRTASR
jgi:hypothetical protein